MDMEMYYLVMIEGVFGTLITYSIGAAVIRNIFYPKIRIALLVFGFFVVLFLTPAMTMVFTASVTWADLSDNSQTGSIAASVFVLLAVIIKRLVWTSGRPEISADSSSASIFSVGADCDVVALDEDTKRMLSSLESQAHAGLITTYEAEERKKELLQDMGNRNN